MLTESQKAHARAMLRNPNCPIGNVAVRLGCSVADIRSMMAEDAAATAVPPPAPTEEKAEAEKGAHSSVLRLLELMERQEQELVHLAEFASSALTQEELSELLQNEMRRSAPRAIGESMFDDLARRVLEKYSVYPKNTESADTSVVAG